MVQRPSQTVQPCKAPNARGEAVGSGWERTGLYDVHLPDVYTLRCRASTLTRDAAQLTMLSPTSPP